MAADSASAVVNKVSVDGASVIVSCLGCHGTANTVRLVEVLFVVDVAIRLTLVEAL